MPIDKDTFVTWMAVFADRYGREIKPPTIRALYTVLRDELSTEEFEAGCQRCLRREAFFPTPQQIIDAARPQLSADVQAARAWDALQPILARSYARREDTRPETAYEKATAIAEMGELVVRAFDAAGGLERWKETPRAERVHMRREFVAAYRDVVAYERERAELAAARAAGPLLPRGGDDAARLLGAGEVLS